MRSLVLMFLVAVGLAVGAGPAAAGGPTSVLLASPWESRATALYHDDTEYTLLQSILDDGETTEASTDDGPYVTVTWLVHDVHIWRTDRIVLGAGVVETTLLMGGTDEPKPVWRKLNQPDRLTTLLRDLGFTGAESPATTTEVAVAPAAQRAPVPVVTEPDARWEWGIGGVLLGALATGLVVRARTVRAGR
ncbi:hypothetical protein [Actinokineospora fastidiosa]|uniref:Uncharacterized protein n=1 Tax=Actinokineospora fastidiosa TaxID=1816 RepID=A0A918LGX8_9PSEU|nr:hypothetical protein [Actinokineospora fastidiosa]GGS47453.1 hypothetical protein GCM10010171_48380 [Actinokineospora fastidiosa]